MKNGLIKSYYDKEYQKIIKREVNYLNDIKNGQEKEYYRNGNINVESIYVNDKLNGLYKYYYENGNIKIECNYVNNKKEGISKEYYDNGILKSEEFYVAGVNEGLMKGYYNNGQLEEEVFYINGLFDGEQKVYYKNGDLENVYFYDKGTIVSEINYNEGEYNLILTRERLKEKHKLRKELIKKKKIIDNIKSIKEENTKDNDLINLNQSIEFGF
jgi:antitoxin component YwqK of YwqJK toxin-antitoxin module